MIKNFTARLLCLSACILSGSIAMAQGPGLVIQRYFTKPASGNESPYEFVELVATRNINFSTDRYTVVFCDAKTATTQGWPQGGANSYGFEIPTTAGSVAAGDLIYVGGSSLVIKGTSCNIARTINTATTNGDGFGLASTAGVLGNGGSHADGLAVFNTTATAIDSTTIPVDAVFYGTAVGNAAGKFKVPANDMYTGGTFGTGAGNMTLASDPGGGQSIFATGTFNQATGNWTVARTWSATTDTASCANAPTITLTTVAPPPPNSLSIGMDSTATTPYLLAPNVSGVISDPTDPAVVQGVVLKIKDNNVAIPAAQYTFTASSSNTTVVPVSNITITKVDGSVTVKILPAAVGYATLTFTLTENSLQSTYVIKYAASAAASSPANAFFHTGYSDASTAEALDDSYMVVSDDEQNKLLVYNRHQSGLPVTTFDYSSLMALTDISGGVPREIDLEASARSLNNTNRIYWMGSHSNKSNPSYDLRPNRNRIFATNVTGTGAATAFSFVGYYDGFRNDMATWSNTNNLGLAASMANGFDPKGIDGLNIEGMAFGPDNTTMYIGFRAPLEPTTNRVNALIAPIQNFETWFGNGTTSAPTLGAPILLDLGGRGIREITRISQNSYIIAAGDYGEAVAITSALYKWNGNPSDAPVLLSDFNVSSFNPEGVLPIYSGGNLSTNSVEIINDDGTQDFYNDGSAAKDLAVNNFKKFSTNVLTTTGNPLPIIFQNFTATYVGNGKAQLNWNMDYTQDYSGFDVERSSDGISFERVANVTINKAQTAFQYIDNVCCVESYLYRIKALNKDGSFAYSAIQLVRLPGSAQLASISHTIHSGTVEINTPANAFTKTVNVFNLNGQRLITQDFDGNSKSISISGLEDGMYIVEVMQEGNATRKKIVK